MKLNRKWIMVIALVMSMAMATGGTLAYLTDRDTVENTFTMGNVDIEVEENFPDDEMYPGVKVEKEAGIKNVHNTSDAWVWMTVSVPNKLVNYIELEWLTGTTVDEATRSDVHEGYTSYVVKHANKLAAGDSTPNYLQGVTLSKNVDFQNGGYGYVDANGKFQTLEGLDDLEIIVDGFAMQTEGFSTVGAAYTAYVEQWNKLGNGDESGANNANAIEVGDADALVDAFTNLKAGDVIKLTDDIDMTGKTITPVTGNKGFTLNGNNHTISNLNSTESALFVAHSGSAAYAFNDLKLENCSVNSMNDYAGLFVGDGDTSDAITITNCHVKNCSVKSNKYASAFIAYTAGYNVQNNGPVYSDITIKNCSVTGGSITGGGSVGAAIAHAGGNADTTNTISNFSVSGVTISGEDADHTGVIVGTAHVGKTSIDSATYSDVTGNYNTEHSLYGRFVPGTTGTLTIDGNTISN